MPRAVIFDRDGIINSEDAHPQSIVMALSELGVVISRDDANQFVGGHPESYSFELEERFGVSRASFLEKQKELYLRCIRDSRISSRVVSTIKKLKSEGYLLGLVTSSDHESTRQILLLSGLEEGFFDVVVTADDVERKKPFPDPYVLAAQQLAVSPSDCLVIEDSPSGVKAAKAAGMRCMAIQNEYTKKKDLSEADYAFDKVNTFEEAAP